MRESRDWDILLLGAVVVWALLILVLAIWVTVAQATPRSKAKFKVVSADRKEIVLRPVVTYDLFGYLRENSDVPNTGQVLSCEAGTETIGLVAEAYGKPSRSVSSVLSLDCGASMR